ncbi:hypothetical protein OHA37_18090 [Streptomyces sp. NBC_00335]|uniref:hypothetical protein n=1 Tax=unclassified Streptomyces TaxID=2593676 RepID=UPI0022518EF3|nr:MULTISPECIES: hypothetical protein [unclassified Streptomyces]MCX5405792.1 hypothetical protein [Streptomyces sp. NBC_00086]
MGATQGKHQEPGKGREAQEHHRSGDPARPQPGKASREQGEKQGEEQAQKHGRKQGQKESSRRREDDLLREEDLHDETF